MSSLDEKIASIPDWVLPAVVATGVAAMIGFGTYLNVRHDRQMDAMREWYGQNPQVFELAHPDPSPLDTYAPTYRGE